MENILFLGYFDIENWNYLDKIA